MKKQRGALDPENRFFGPKDQVFLQEKVQDSGSHEHPNPAFIQLNLPKLPKRKR